MTGLSPKTAKPKVGKNTGNAGKGRPKGVPNKLSGQLKDMILAALAEAGGTEYLVQQSEDNPVAFMTLVGKVLPLQVAGDPNGVPIKHAFQLSDDALAAIAMKR